MKSRSVRWLRHGTYCGEGSAYRVLVVKAEGETERPCERPRWDFNIKMDLKEIESGGGVNWICMT